MSAIRAELLNYINQLPDYKLVALKPMFEMISTDEVTIIEKINFEDLEDDEKQAVLQGREDFKNGKTFRHEDIDWDNLDNLNLD